MNEENQENPYRSPSPPNPWGGRKAARQWVVLFTGLAAIGFATLLWRGIGLIGAVIAVAIWWYREFRPMPAPPDTQETRDYLQGLEQPPPCESRAAEESGARPDDAANDILGNLRL